MAIKHAFASAKADGTDATQVRPVNWNADHTGILAIRKTADQAVTNSTQLVNDDHLKFAMAANEKWIFELCLFVDGPTGADIRIAFSVPTGATLIWAGTGLELGAMTLDEVGMGPVRTTSDGASGFGLIAGTPTFIAVSGTVENGVNAGDLQLRWAQQVADPITASGIYKNSWLKAHTVS